MPLNNDDNVKIITPVLNSFLVPARSPNLPTGSKDIAVARRKDVTTQLNVIASRLKLFSIEGNAIFTEEIRNVLMKEVHAIIAIIVICFFVQCISKFKSCNSKSKNSIKTSFPKL